MQEGLAGHQGRAAIAHRRGQAEDIAREHPRLEGRFGLRFRRRRLLLRSYGWNRPPRPQQRRRLPGFSRIALGDEGAAQHQSRADRLQHSKFLVQRHHRQQHGEGHLKLDHRGGEVHAH